MDLGYLGPPGTFTQQAAHLWLSGTTARTVPFDTIADVMDAVQSGHCNLGIVPIENALEGPVNHTVDVLVSSPDLHVIGECVLPIEQHLITLPETEFEDVKEVWSHPQALAQCRTCLRSLGVVTKAYPSTAKAAQELAESQVRHVAVVGSRTAATMFGLKVLRARIQDEDYNETRFVIVGTTPMEGTIASKSMILITPNHERSGVLASILSVFATFQLNLSWIESRPTRTRLGKYQFIVEIESGINAPDMRIALEVVQAFGHEVRVLGSYPRWQPRGEGTDPTPH